MEAWLDRVMVEHICPDCKGSRLRATRLLFTIADKSVYDVGQMHFDELHAFLGRVKPSGRGAGHKSHHRVIASEAKQSPFACSCARGGDCFVGLRPPRNDAIHLAAMTRRDLFARRSRHNPGGDG